MSQPWQRLPADVTVQKATKRYRFSGYPETPFFQSKQTVG